MNRRIIATSILVLALFVAAMEQANALWVSIHITKNGEYGDRQVDIRTRDVEGGMREFEVTLRPTEKGKPVSPFISASAAIIQDDKWVAKLPMSERRYKDRIVYKFSVSQAAIAGSKVEINESNFKLRPDDQRTKVASLRDSNFEEHLMGGASYWFWLREVDTGKP